MVTEDLQATRFQLHSSGEERTARNSPSGALRSGGPGWVGDFGVWTLDDSRHPGDVNEILATRNT